MLSFASPLISVISVAPTPGSALVTWTTDKIASSNVVYSSDNSYGFSTGLADVAPRVTAHSVFIPSLASCLTYNYKVVSFDEYGDVTTSSPMTFETSGCAHGGGGGGGGAPFVSSQGSETTAHPMLDFTINGGSGVATDPMLQLAFNGDASALRGYTISLNAGAASSSMIAYVSSTHFALPNASGVYTVYVQYYASTGQPSTLVHHVIELRLAGTNATATGVSSMSGASFSADTSSAAPAVHSITLFTRNLKRGDTSPDVKRLAQFLNTHGFLLAKNGPGSPGKETTTFAQRLSRALKRFQLAHLKQLVGFKKKQAAGQFDAVTRGLINRMK